MILHGEQAFTIHKRSPRRASSPPPERSPASTTRARARSPTSRPRPRTTPASSSSRTSPASSSAAPAASAASAARRRATSRRSARPTRRVSDGDAAQPGDDLPPLRRPQPAARRPRLREDGRLRPPDPARPLQLRLRRPRGPRRVLRQRPGAVRRHVRAASPASSTRATRSRRRCGTTGDGKIIVQAKTQEGRVVISNAAAEVK